MTPAANDQRHEAALLLRWQAGHKDAGAELIRRLSPMLIRYFRLHLDGDTQDLVQDTLMHLVSAKAEIRDGRSIRAYAYRTARFKLLEHLRSLTRRRAINPLTHSIVDMCPRASAELRGRQEAELLLWALRSLPLDSQITLQLYYIERLSYREIADLYGVERIATMQSRMHTHRQALRKIIATLDAPTEIVASLLGAIEYWAAELRGELFDIPSPRRTPPST